MSDPIKKAISLEVSNHPRLSEFNRLVYPVVSRRAGGISLGINLNPSKICSFDCVYCQVDRSQKIKDLKVSLDQIAQEVDFWIKSINDPDSEFCGQALKDISIAGDGEPTLCKLLPEVLSKLADIKEKHQLYDCKLVLFTNGSNIDRPEIRNALSRFYKHNGEIWFKLDYWDEASYQRINRGRIGCSSIIENLIKLGRTFPVVLQSCFFSWDNQPFSTLLYKGYIEQVNKLLQAEVKIRSIQVYTLARKPADLSAKPWSNANMDQLYRFLSDNLNLKLSLIYSNPVKST